MKEFFTTEDFVVRDPNGECLKFRPCSEADYIAHVANRKLEKEGKVLEGRIDGNFGWHDVVGEKYPDLQRHLLRKTHKAILINIQPIEKKECEHGSIMITGWRDLNGGGEARYKCLNCEKVLKPTWEVIP
jgi:hypothetical protein